MAGFCSCKTGIHAFHGNNLGTTTEACLQHRYRGLRSLARGNRRVVTVVDLSEL
jgi:hypothetical protein